MSLSGRTGPTARTYLRDAVYLTAFSQVLDVPDGAYTSRSSGAQGRTQSADAAQVRPPASDTRQVLALCTSGCLTSEPRSSLGDVTIVPSTPQAFPQKVPVKLVA